MNDETEIGARILIRGRVQGVGFRAWLAGRARRAGLSGWCRNLASGEVEAVLSGSPAAVGAVIEDCRQGPGWARVDAVDIFSDAEPVAGEFQIRAAA